MTESRDAALARLRPWVERARTFSGWDFSMLRTRPLDAPAWDYARVVAGAARGRRSAVDLGTGGGERLARMRDALPPRLVATETWHVNAPIAYRALRPLGVDVVRAWSEDGALPFRDASFDLVIDRHEALDPAEVARVLEPGGTLVTQQVSAHHFQELRPHFPRKAVWPDHLAQYGSAFRSLGFDVETAHQDVRVAYPTLGEVVYMIAVAPWDIADFDLERDLDALLALEAECTTAEGMVLTECYYRLTATKPPGSRA
jgi:SAM-dependent methyltransferase